MISFFVTINTTIQLNIPNKQPGIYLICDAGGPIYAGRSSKSVKRRMLAHLNGYGNENIKIATKIKEIAQNLTFTYFDVPASSVAEVEIFLIEALGVTRLANMRREARFEEDDPLNIGE